MLLSVLITGRFEPDGGKADLQGVISLVSKQVKPAGLARVIAKLLRQEISGSREVAVELSEVYKEIIQHKDSGETGIFAGIMGLVSIVVFILGTLYYWQ